MKFSKSFFIPGITVILFCGTFCRKTPSNPNPVYSPGNLLEFSADSDWFIPYNLRPVIATYNLAPDTVRNQLAVMYANGQRKIVLDLWYSDFSDDGSLASADIYGHVINSRFGRLLPLHESNLRSLLIDIVNQGFNEILFRFDVRGDSDPRGWTNWQEARYQLNRSFISNTKAAVVQDLQGRSIKVIYDLDGELGGCPLGLSEEYELRLRQDYGAAYGSHNSVGLSSPG